MSRHRAHRSAALLLAAAAILISLGACGGHDDGPGVATAGGDAAGRKAAGPSAEQYADCLRRGGVVLLADLSEEGLPLVDKAGTPAGVLATAQDACRQFQPQVDEPEPVSPDDLERARQHAACVRTHGVPSYPDPNPRTGQPDADGSLAHLKRDPAFRAALDACRDLRMDAAAAPG